MSSFYYEGEVDLNVLRAEIYLKDKNKYLDEALEEHFRDEGVGYFPAHLGKLRILIEKVDE